MSVNNASLTFQAKNYNFGRHLYATVNLTQYFKKDFSEKLIIINKCDFFILYNETFQYLEDLSKLVNQYLPTDQCVMSQAGGQVKKPSSARQFNGFWCNSKGEAHQWLFRFHVATNLSEMTTCQVLVFYLRKL